MATAAFEPVAGDVLGSWCVVAPLGSGAFATTWRVCDPGGRSAALKLLPEAPEDELRALHCICHPAVVQLLDAGNHPQPYMVMELADGEPLSQILSDLDEAVSIGIAAVLCDALAAVHHAGVLHRDIKPDNIIVALGERPHPWIVDFGFAGIDGAGTMAYAAPEVLQGRAVGSASDVYSMGMVIWEMLHGTLPGSSLGMEASLIARCQAAPEPHEGPGWLREALSGMLAVEPSRRPTAASLSDTFAAHGIEIPRPDRRLIERRAQGVWIGQPAVEAAAEQWRREGGSLALVGTASSGRSHALRQLACEVLASGRAVVQMEGSGRAWSGARSALRAALGGAVEPSIPAGPDRFTRAEDAARIIAESSESMVVMVDDVEMIDEPSLLVLRQLHELGVAICVAGTRRPEWIERSAPLTELSEEEVARLVSALLGTEAPPEDAVGWIYGFAGGIPAMVVSTVAANVESRALSLRAGRWIWDPTSLARIDDIDPGGLPVLTDEARRTGALVALHGQPIDISAVVPGTERAVEELIGLGLLRRDGGLVRCMSGTIAESLKRCSPDRVADHRRLLDWICTLPEPPILPLVEHALAVSDAELTEKYAATAIKEACAEDPLFGASLAERISCLCASPELEVLRLRALISAGRIDQARFLGEMLRETIDEDDRRPLLITLAQFYADHDTSPTAALECLAEAEASTSPLSASENLAFAVVLDTAERPIQAIEYARMIADCPWDAPGVMLRDWLRARYIWAQATHHSGDLQAALEILSAIPSSLGQGTDSRATLDAAHARLLWLSGRFQEAEKALERASQADSGLPMLDRARLCNNLGAIRYRTGDRVGALEAWEQALALFERLSAVTEIVRAQINLCLGYQEMGRWARSRQAGESALRGAAEVGAPELECLAADNLVQLALAQSLLDEAESLVHHAEELVTANDLHQEGVEIAMRRAELAITRQQADALSLCTLAESIARHERVELMSARARVLRAVCMAREGDRESADRLLDSGLQALQAAGDTGELANARLWAVEVLMLTDRLEAAANTLEQVHCYAREVGLVPFCLRAEALTSRLSARWRPSDDDDQLDQIRQIAVEIGRPRRLPELLQGIAEAALDLLSADRAFVLMGEPPEIVSASYREGESGTTLSMSVVEQAIRGGREVIAVDINNRSDLQLRESIVALGLRSVLCVPMMHDDALGAIYVDSMTVSQRRFRQTA
ncbi:MAG: tetratricopeptide (TPR) repeat protein, partial [Myxococcota bacterium]